MGNHKNLSYEEEAKLLKVFFKEVESGQIVYINETNKEYAKKVNYSIGNSQIYRVLKRHGW